MNGQLEMFVNSLNLRIIPLLNIESARNELNRIWHLSYIPRTMTEKSFDEKVSVGDLTVEFVKRFSTVKVIFRTFTVSNEDTVKPIEFSLDLCDEDVSMNRLIKDLRSFYKHYYRYELARQNLTIKANYMSERINLPSFAETFKNVTDLLNAQLSDSNYKIEYYCTDTEVYARFFVNDFICHVTKIISFETLREIE